MHLFSRTFITHSWNIFRWYSLFFNYKKVMIFLLRLPHHIINYHLDTLILRSQHMCFDSIKMIQLFKERLTKTWHIPWACNPEMLKVRIIINKIHIERICWTQAYISSGNFFYVKWKYKLVLWGGHTGFLWHSPCSAQDPQLLSLSSYLCSKGKKMYAIFFNYNFSLNVDLTDARWYRIKLTLPVFPNVKKGVKALMILSCWWISCQPWFIFICCLLLQLWFLGDFQELVLRRINISSTSNILTERSLLVRKLSWYRYGNF